MAYFKLSVVLLLVFFCHTAQGSSILALFSSLSFSDHYVFRAYVALMAMRGHSVVVMTPYPGHFHFPEKERIVELDVGEASAPLWEEYKALVTNTDDYYTRTKAIHEFNIKLAIAQLKSKQMTALFVNPNVKFDLVITEAEVPLLYAVADKYKANHIAFTTNSGSVSMYESKGCPTHPLLYPDVNTLNYRDLGLWQKVTELNRFFHARREYYSNYLPLSQVAAEKVLGLKRDLLEVEQEIDLLFVSGSPILIGNRPSVPAVAYVDRLHIKPGLPLPPNIRGILDSSDKGAIFFSLGAIQESEALSRSTLDVLKQAFSELPYRVLWKAANATILGELPPNVVIQPWYPQQEILAHPNVKAFITHGGPRSLEEAVFYGVPIVGFPIVKSRKVFMNEITRHGAGEILDPLYMDKESLKSTIQLVASKDKYKQAVLKLKAVAQDAVISGPDHAIWWTEYVLRHGSARHMRSAGVGESPLFYYVIDVLGFLPILGLALLWAFYLVLRVVVKKVKAKIAARADLAKFKAL